MGKEGTIKPHQHLEEHCIGMQRLSNSITSHVTGLQTTGTRTFSTFGSFRASLSVLSWFMSICKQSVGSVIYSGVSGSRTGEL